MAAVLPRVPISQFWLSVINLIVFLAAVEVDVKVKKSPPAVMDWLIAPIPEIAKFVSTINALFAVAVPAITPAIAFKLTDAPLNKYWELFTIGELKLPVNVKLLMPVKLLELSKTKALLAAAVPAVDPDK